MVKRDSSSLNAGRGRARSLAAFAVLFFMVLVVRLFLLQVVRHDEYARFAEDNQLHRDRVVAPRGYIRDRHGEILVDNVLHFEVVMPWRERGDVAEAAQQLASYLPVDTAKVMAHFEAWRAKHGRVAFPIVPDADKFIISFVRENADIFPSLRVKSRARRRYREGTLASHVLGYVGEASGNDLTRGGRRPYFAGDLIGKTALELSYERELRGVDGQRVLEVNASGSVLGEVVELSIPPTPGRDVYLTVDGGLQVYLEALLGAASHPGAAVVMAVDDGSILAAASSPSFDPNEFATGISQANLSALFEAPTKPMFNRLSQARYPPASTFKMVTAYAILDNRLVNPDAVLVYCTGAYKFGNRFFRCWQEDGHGSMNLMSALVQSCDVYFYKVGEVMDVDILANAARAFGFGQKTGIDLGGEVKGLVPDRRYYDDRFGKGKWTQGHVLNNIIGQGEFLSSVLHVARVSSAIANEGFLVQPHLVDHIEGEPRVAYPKKRVPRLSGTNLRFIRRAMEGVVANPSGTARWTRLDWIRVAGKTGTAQNPHGEPHAWYMAYAPADAPEIALAVLVENAGHGGEIAAPIARDIITRYFRPEILDAKAADAATETGLDDTAVEPEREDAR